MGNKRAAMYQGSRRYNTVTKTGAPLLPNSNCFASYSLRERQHLGSLKELLEQNALRLSKSMIAENFDVADDRDCGVALRDKLSQCGMVGL